MVHFFQRRGAPSLPSKTNARNKPGFYTIQTVSLRNHWAYHHQRQVRVGEMHINYTRRTFFEAVKECQRLNLTDPVNLHYPVRYRRTE